MELPIGVGALSRVMERGTRLESIHHVRSLKLYRLRPGINRSTGRGREADQSVRQLGGDTIEMAGECCAAATLSAVTKARRRQ